LKPAHWPRRLRAGSLLAAGTAGSLLLLSAVAPAGAATGPSTGKVAVPQALSIAGLVGLRGAVAHGAGKTDIHEEVFLV